MAMSRRSEQSRGYDLHADLAEKIVLPLRFVAACSKLSANAAASWPDSTHKIIICAF